MSHVTWAFKRNFFNATPISIGTVDDKQRRWLPAKEFSIDNPEMREDKDYMTMKYEERSMDTDTVIKHFDCFRLASFGKTKIKSICKHCIDFRSRRNQVT